MELSSQEVEIPIPIPIPINSTTTYGHGNGHGHGLMIHHEPPQQHIISSTAPSNGTGSMQHEDHHHVDVDVDVDGQGGGGGGGYSNSNMNKKMVRYRECLKNHAAAMGGNATDGCGEFMPSGEEGSIEALNCSACHCHRNFHRKEIQGEPSSCEYQYPFSRTRRLILGPPHTHKNLLSSDALGYPTPANILPSRTVPPHHMIMPYNIGPLPSESDEQEDAPLAGSGMVHHHQPRHSHLVKKRFRTKFTQEQKDKMLNFADKVGWKIQKQEESVVQQFCQEIGVKRRVLKVWMHNNKHNLAKKNNLETAPTPPTTTAATATPPP